MIKDLKFILRTYKIEVWILIASFAFALAGDLIYGGVEGADAFLVGVVLGSASNLFFTVFLIMVLFRLVTKFIHSKSFYNVISKIEDRPAPKGKSK